MISNGFDSPRKDVFKLIESVYAASDAFASEFEDDFPNLRAFSRYLDELKKRQGHLFLVACDESGLAGFLVVEPKIQRKLRHTAFFTMGLRPGAQGKGYGRRLLEEAIARLQAEGTIEILYLMVREDNDPAIKLYEKMGFTTLTRLDHDTKSGDQYYSALLMRHFIRPRP